MPTAKGSSMKLETLLLSIGLLLCAVAVDAATLVYAKTPTLKVRSEASAMSDVVAEEPRGAVLELLGKERFFYRVRTAQGVTGYVSRMQVSDKPLDRRSTGLGGLIREDRAPEEMRTAASARGLAEQAEELARAEGISPRDVESLRRMEQRALAISPAEVDAFLREGGLPV